MKKAAEVSLDSPMPVESYEGVMTQMCTEQTMRSVPSKSQTAQNIVLKVCAKLGGVNHMLSLDNKY